MAGFKSLILAGFCPPCDNYLGYPLILKMFSTCYKNLWLKKDITPTVTLLICAHNEESVILEKIQNSVTLDYPEEKLNIVIASDGSTDRTEEIVRNSEYYGKVKLFHYPKREGKMKTIIKTVPQIKDEIIVFSEANTMYNPDAIRKLTRNFFDETVGGVSADVIVKNEGADFGESESVYYLYERWIQKKESEFDSIVGADGAMYAIRRKLFVAPSSNIILDDFVISMNVKKKGFRLVYDEEAVGYEIGAPSSRVEFLRKSRVIAGAIQSILLKEGIPSIKQGKLFFCYVSHKILRWFVPIFLVVLFIVNLSIAIKTGSDGFFTTLILQILFYLSAFSWIFFKGGKAKLFILIPYYFCLVNAAALFGIYKGLLNKQPVTWQKFSR